jgi:hypothetical protein
VPDPVRIEDLTPLTALAQAQSTISDLEQRVSELERVGDELARVAELMTDRGFGYIARPGKEAGTAFADALSAKNEALAEWRRLRAGGEA